MPFVDANNVLDACDAMRRAHDAYLPARERLREVILETAKLDQTVAEFQEKELRALDTMTDAVVEKGKCLISKLYALAKLGTMRGELVAQSRDAKSDSELLEIENALAESAKSLNSLGDNEVCRFVSDCAGYAAYCLQGLAEALASEDVHSACQYCKLASKITRAMREIHDLWPWTDQQAVTESWKQYERGELMDFETFKHELLKVAQ